MRTQCASNPARLWHAVLLAVSLGVVPAGTGAGSTGSITQNLVAVIQPTAELSVQTSVAMAGTGGKFHSYQAAVTISYRARTTSLGGGSITLQVTSDFSPAGGPSAQAGALQYSCSGATLGKPCVGLQTAAVNLQTPVLALPAAVCTGGGGACSPQDLNSVTVNFTLPDDPGYSTGSYSAQMTFVISAT